MEAEFMALEADLKNSKPDAVRRLVRFLQTYGDNILEQVEYDRVENAHNLAGRIMANTLDLTRDKKDIVDNDVLFPE